MLESEHHASVKDSSAALHPQGDRYENIKAALALLPQHGIEVTGFGSIDTHIRRLAARVARHTTQPLPSQQLLACRSVEEYPIC
jgi:hypothetical protein